MKTRITFLMVITFVSSTFAHSGPRVWIGNLGGRITTFTSDNDLSPTTYTQARVFGSGLVDTLGVFSASFPGYEVRKTGGNIAASTTFGFDITGPLLVYDCAGNQFLTTTQMFGPPDAGTIPQMGVSLSTSTRITGAGAGAVAGFDFFTFNAIGDHRHLSYTLADSAGVTFNGPDAVYVLPLRLTSPILETSEPYYLLLGKGFAPGNAHFEAARAAATAQLVPEPMTFAWIGLGAMILRRKRSSTRTFAA